MPIGRGDVIARLEHIIMEATALMVDLQKDKPAGPQVESGSCPVHHIPWISTKYGLAHKMTDGSGWCNKARLEKTEALRK
jgi:hypothetical protein